MPQVAAQVVIGAGLWVIGQALGMGSESDQPASEEIDRGFLLNKCSDTAVLPLLYGRGRCGVNRVYAKTWGDDNGLINLACLMGEGEIDGIVRQDGTIYQTTDSALPSDNPPLVYFDDKLFTEWGQHATIYFFNGSSTQGLSTRLTSHDDTFAQYMRRTAYLVVSLSYDLENFNRIPDITVVYNGLKVYNPVADTTAWSDNPALCAYDFMTRPSTRGGMGLAASTIKAQELSDAIDYCDDLGLTCNMPVNNNTYAVDNLKLILDNFRGKVPPSDNGRYRMLFRDLNYESTVMALTEDDVVDGSFSLTQPSVLMRPNAIRVQYYSSAEDHNYQMKEYVYTDTTALAADGDYREISVGPFGLDTLSTVQPMAYYLLERERNKKAVTISGGRRTLALEPEDLVTLTHRVPGWTAQTLRVIKTSPDFTTWTNALTLLEESEEFYNAVYDTVLEDLFQTTLPSPTADVPDVVNVSHSEKVYNYRDQSYTRWTIEFEPPDESVYPFFDYAEVWVKIGADGDWNYMTPSRQGYVIDPAQEGEYYAVRLVSVSTIGGKKQNFDNALTVSKTILGKTSLPSDLASMSALANGDSVTIYADRVDDPDIDGYEVRLGDSWDGAIFISFNKAPSLRLNGVRPGTHTFWMSPKDTAGRYSGTSVSASVKVFTPPGYTELATYGSWAWDYDGIGTHNNTEHTTYDSGDAMKCSHAGNVLAGTWTSPSWDLGSEVKVRVWGDYLTAFESSATTWQGVAPDPITWSQLGTSQTWAEIFQPLAAGRVQATLQHSTDDSTFYNVANFEVLSAEVQTRYVRVAITITDPTLDSNLYVKELNMLAYTGPQ